jgi:ABC-2 type transport system ATP-binding protein
MHMSVEATSRLKADRSRPGPGGPVAVEVRDLHKSFSIPTQRVDSLKERVVHPFATRHARELHALDGISFEIYQGEFFGIVGRNGSGKSTLLKLLASIYRADAGKIRIAGRLAPFIELGVGFNHDLTARENVVLNGVMMGLTPREMKGRLNAIIEFAELTEFVDLKLKNYSSGMLVRLAFAVMMEADADVLLIDEVLAVGDAAFQQKCTDAFIEMKAAGKTIILVTHEMGTVEEFCHRAMLISEGRIQRIGDPAEVGRDYLRLNFDGPQEAPATEAEEDGPDEFGESGESDEIRLLDARVENEAGASLKNVEYGGPLRICIELEAKRDLPGVDVGFLVANAENVGVLNFGIPVKEGEEPRDIYAGERVTVRAVLDNNLADGRYYVHCGFNRAFGGGIALYVANAIDFHVYGSPPTRGMVLADVALSAEVEAGR